MTELENVSKMHKKGDEWIQLVYFPTIIEDILYFHSTFDQLKNPEKENEETKTDEPRKSILSKVSSFFGGGGKKSKNENPKNENQPLLR